jgi:hypothetical protein
MSYLVRRNIVDPYQSQQALLPTIYTSPWYTWGGWTFVTRWGPNCGVRAQELQARCTTGDDSGALLGDVLLG